MTAFVYPNDARVALPQIPSTTVQCIVTSPPYLGLRSYDIPDTLWKPPYYEISCDDKGIGCDWETVLPCGARTSDSSPGKLQTPGTMGRDKWRSKVCIRCRAYYGQLGGEPSVELYIDHLRMIYEECRRILTPDGLMFVVIGDSYAPPAGFDGIGSKNMMGVPWELARELRHRGWTLRSDIIWAKPNPVPESVGDRPWRSHEHIFMLSKSKKYKYNAAPWSRLDVWTISPEASGVPHYATFPTRLVQECITIATDPGDLVMDPMAGVGTVSLVAEQLQRDSIYVEPSDKYQQYFRDKWTKAGLPGTGLS